MNILATITLGLHYVQSAAPSPTPSPTGNELTTVYLLSFVIAGFASLIMWLAYRRIRSERWIMYFCISFAALSMNYLVGFIKLQPLQLFLRDTLSLVSNIFGVAAALEIQNRSPLFSVEGETIKPIESKGDRILHAICWTLIGLSAITVVLKIFIPPPSSSEVATEWIKHTIIASPEMIFSALCISLMGYAIFANLGSRQFRWWAPIALIMAIVYALVQIGYGLRYFISWWGHISTEQILKFMIWIALPLKFFLCLFACFLVVRFFEILSKLAPMQETEFEKRQDYLASEGVVAWIGKKLSDKALSDKALRDKANPKYSEAAGECGFVNLVIRLPGEMEKRVACIVWPHPEEDKRPKILDWIPEEKKFSPLSTEVHPFRAELWEWERFLPLVHDALNSDETGTSSDDEVKSTYRGNLKTIITRPIKVNGAAIGCLQIARSDSHFSQMGRRQIFQISNLLAPSVQSYRELAGLDLMSIIFAKKLGEELPYSPKDAVESIIVKLLHDVFAPTLTRLSVDFGFSSPGTYYEIEKDVGDLKKVLEKELAGKKVEQYRGDVTSRFVPRTYKLLKKRLTTRVAPSLGAHREKLDEFILGDLLFAVDSEQDAYRRPVLGVNYLHRKTACTLAAAAFLDFSREYFSHLLKKLGKELSGKRLNIEDWFNPIRNILTEEAKFCWVVVRQRRQKTWLGDAEGLRAMERMKNVKHEVKTRPIRGSDEIRRQYYFSDQESDTNHILKLRLNASESFIWLGISRPGFGPELDFPSPWKTFLVNFVQIADASLSRITIPEKFKEHVEAAQLQGIIASVATTGTMVHQLSNLVASQQHAIRSLRDGFAFGKIKATANTYEKILRAMDNESTSVLQLVKAVRTLTSTSDQRPCRLADVARHAFKLYEVSLEARYITKEIDIDDDIWINVPFTVAALALANLVGNSKDAIMNSGRIHIDAREDGETVICHVEDTGPGIASETRDRIFEPKSVTKPYGTGMGLYLTRHSLWEYDSSIELTESNDKGSKFTIRFPKAKGRTN